MESLLKGRLPSLPGSLFQGSATLAVRDSSSCGAGTPRVWFKAITPRLSLGPTEKSGHFLAPASEIFTRIDELKGGLITHFAGKPSSPQPSICREYKGRFNPAPVPLSPARPAPSRRPPRPGAPAPHRPARSGPISPQAPPGDPRAGSGAPRAPPGQDPRARLTCGRQLHGEGGHGGPAGGKEAAAARPGAFKRAGASCAVTSDPPPPWGESGGRSPSGAEGGGARPLPARGKPSPEQLQEPRSAGRAWAPSRAEDSERRCRPRDRAGGQCPGCSTARELFPRGHGGH